MLDHRQIAARSRRVRFAEGRIDRNRLVVVGHRLDQAAVTRLVPVKATGQVGLIRRWTLRVALTGRRRRQNLVRQGSGDFGCHLGLHRQTIGQLAIVALGPDVGLAPGFNELRGDAHAVAGAPDAALDEVVGAQRLADFGRALLGVLVEHRGMACDDTDAAGAALAELGDHLLGQPVAEKVVLRLTGEIGERQHHQAGPTRRSSRVSRHDGACDGWLEPGDKTVASPMQGLNVAGGVGAVIERGPQPFDRRVHTVLEIDRRAVRPQPFLDLVAGHDFTWPLEEHRQNLKGLLLQADRRLTLSQLAGPQVAFKALEPDHAGVHGL
jgi:hypothetical protein